MAIFPKKHRIWYVNGSVFMATNFKKCGLLKRLISFRLWNKNNCKGSAYDSENKICRTTRRLSLIGTV